MRVLGIDLGSREVKVAIVRGKEIECMDKYSTMQFYRDFCFYDGALNLDLGKLGVGEIDKGISTGYGRNNTLLSGFETINELKAHAIGAMAQTGFRDFVLLDMGGQDVKVIKVEKGLITDIDLNAKCAASCGRYLENMAAVLEISLDELSMWHSNPVELSSTCAVFSESELIGKIAEGNSMETLCAGVNYSLYKRLRPMLEDFSSSCLLMSGGVSLNAAIKEYLKRDYAKLIMVPNAQWNGAIGCCFYEIGKIMKK